MRRLQILTTAVAVLVCHHVGWAKPKLSADVRCRKQIARNLSHYMAASLHALDVCHQRRDREGIDIDCNRLFTLTPPPATFSNALLLVGIARSRAQGVIAAHCGRGLNDNYPDVTSADQIINALNPSLVNALQENGATVQGAPQLSGDATGARAKRRCHAVIGRARSRIALGAIRAATACQASLDPTATHLAEIDRQCDSLAPSARLVASVSRKVERGCGGVTGAAVGSCDPLPDCLITSGTTLGQDLARLFYGATAEQRALLCGNGELDPGEACDDGNQVDTDACTGKCRKATCGDGIVESGVEECDEGSANGGGVCSSDCKLGSCGDGVVQPGEECDDGNQTSGDGCSACVLDPVTCNADGIEVVVCLARNQQTASSLQGVEVNFSYAPPLAIPGSGLASSVRDRVTDLTPSATKHLGQVADRDALPSGAPDGVDDTLRNVYATQGTPAPELPFGAFERIYFDCPSGTSLQLHDFVCQVPAASDSLGNEIMDQAARPQCIFGLALSGGPSNNPACQAPAQ